MFVLLEIDHNFSRAHRIVTTSILPIVEQYSEHSKAVWEGSKFWKQFFEASANVSLSSYEEGAPGESEAGEQTELDEDLSEAGEGGEEYEEQTVTSAVTPSQSLNVESPSKGAQETPQTKVRSKTQLEDSLLSTPKNPPAKSGPTMADFSSPYESLKRELRGSPPPDQGQESELPSTPRNPGSSPVKSLGTVGIEQKSQRRKPPAQTPGTSNRQNNNDVMLHRVLDKNYRLAATPLTTGRRRAPESTLPRRATKATADTPSASSVKQKPPIPVKSSLFDDLDSSPAAPAPTLNADLFNSPAPANSRVPGISVLASAKKRTPRRPTTDDADDDGLSAADRRRRDEWDDDDDDGDQEDTDGDLLPGMSPPKTLQFHVPQSRLLQTPGKINNHPFTTLLIIFAQTKMLTSRFALYIAREASKRIVEDLLLTAAGGDDDDDNDGGDQAMTPPRRTAAAAAAAVLDDGEDSSPSIVKPSRQALEDDDTF